MLRKLASAAIVLFSSGCSLLFDGGGGPSDEIFPVGQRPVLRFDFEEVSDEPIDSVVSTGSEKLELILIGGAEVVDGALQLLHEDTATYAKSFEPATGFNQQCPENQSLTVAAWVTPKSTDALAFLPARIFSVENLSGLATNFTLGQGAADYGQFVVRVGGDLSDRQIEAASANLVDDEPVFLFFSIEESGNYRFQVGDRSSENNVLLDPTISWTWNPNFVASLGASDEGDRPWKGLIHHIELYCRALNASEQERLKKHTDPR